MQPGSEPVSGSGDCVEHVTIWFCSCRLFCFVCLRQCGEDSQAWGRRSSNVEAELEQMLDAPQLYHNPAYPVTDLRRWLQKGSIWSKVPANTPAEAVLYGPAPDNSASLTTAPSMPGTGHGW